MNTTEQVKSFIENNKLDFSDSGSGLNSACIILSGYALHVGVTDVKELQDVVNDIDSVNNDADEMLEKCFKYAKKKNYQKYWETEDAHKSYKF